jgi:hypothetical protein
MHKMGERVRFRIAPERLVPRCGRGGFYEPDEVHEELWTAQHDSRLRDGSILPFHEPPAAEEPVQPAADPSAEAEGDKPVPDEGAPKDSP